MADMIDVAPAIAGFTLTADAADTFIGMDTNGIAVPYYAGQTVMTVGDDNFVNARADQCAVLVYQLPDLTAGDFYTFQAALLGDENIFIYAYEQPRSRNRQSGELTNELFAGIKLPLKGFVERLVKQQAESLVLSGAQISHFFKGRMTLQTVGAPKR